MANNKHDNTIKILKDRNGLDNWEHIDEEYCVICENLPINPCHGLCGCIYCWDCIEKYLNDNEKCCPGQLEDCKYQILNIENNILVDQSTKRQISRVIVKYPEQSGQFSEELRKIQERMISTKSFVSKCPFSDIGCRDNKPINEEEIEHHLTNQNLCHTKLLIECIDNLKYEIKSIKSELEKSKKEMEIMKCEAKQNQELISELQYNDNLKSQHIDYLLEKLHENETDSNETEFTVFDDKSDISSVRMSSIKLSNNAQRSINIINDKLVKFNKQLQILETNVEKVTYGEFVWVVNKFSQKINEARKLINTELYSDSFYTHKNGYKMCLRIDPIGVSFGKGSHLAVYFCMLQGSFDSILSWPMKYDVTFALIEQETGFVHKSRTARFDDHPDNFAWNRPTSDQKIGYGYHKFIGLEELINNQSLCQSDQIFIKCTVHVTP